MICVSMPYTDAVWTDQSQKIVRALFESETTADRAVRGGLGADRIGFAFRAGYTEALRALVPDLTGIAALCATEEGGAHPKAIRTTLAAGELNGRKKWATGADQAASLLVVASVGDEGGKNRLRVVRIAANAPGVTMHASAAAFVPEIQHAEVELSHVRVSEADVLPGDGYDDYLKPFRTVEDAHVHAALAGYLISVATRRGWRELAERLLALALATRSVALADAKAAATHLALAGVLDLATRVIAEVEAAWAAAPDDEHARWLRDRPILKVASGARSARRERAWELMS
jgi:alkylation response protein AidB-like acyl-CoA dehydrogenase